MGHKPFDFETMMMTLSHGQKHGVTPELKCPLSSIPKVLDLSSIPDAVMGKLDRPVSFESMVKSFAELPAKIEKAKTFCFEFSQEFLKPKSGNFTKTDLFFDAEGLIAQYHCSRDDRTYTVKITASKDKPTC